jgi:sortase (surface protein transpeptidase)
MDTPAPVALAPVTADGVLAVPDDVSQLGWWVGGAPMGATAGTTLIAGHVDSAEEGLGVFAQLRDLTPGHELTVLDGLGASHRFRVSATVEVGKAELPAELFDSTGERRLALVTCSGPFDAEARSYRNNLIVWATPI